MTPDLIERMKSETRRYYVPRPTQKPSQWCIENLRFDEPGNRGPFSVAGAEHCIEPLDDFADTSLSDIVDVWGSQTHKTGTIMGGAAWRAVNMPCNCLWAMPSINLAGSFTRKRWIPMLRASDATRNLLPVGAERHDVKTWEQRVGAAAFKFVGSNSAANLASEPCQLVILDEVDKFDTGGREEADAVNLAEQRTKGQVNPQRRKTSTPTLIEGIIWQEALKGDMRRRFLPCWHCGRQNSSRRVVLAWSESFSTLPKTGVEAFVAWDKEAKRADGKWDLDRVERSARFRCPHCGKDILDAHKTWMNREGVWQPTQKAHSGFRSRHLPSLYACSPETTVGKLAVKFLQAKNSLLGLQGFINGDLAEPYQSQDRQTERVELITSRLEVTSEEKILLGVDCQHNSPHFWWVKRAWNGGNSRGIAAGPADQWDDLRAIQNAPGAKVPDVGVFVDSGFGAKSDAEVYRSCARFGEIVSVENRPIPSHIGWMPTKGMPGRKRWKSEESGLYVPFFVRNIDPFIGTSDAGKVEMGMLEFSGDYFKDILENLRKGLTEFKWTVSQDMATEEYWRHMDAELKVAERNRLTGKVNHIWQPRARHWPNHMFDCEVIQIAAAIFLQFFDEVIVEPKKEENV